VTSHDSRVDRIDDTRRPRRHPSHDDGARTAGSFDRSIDRSSSPVERTPRDGVVRGDDPRQRQGAANGVRGRVETIGDARLGHRGGGDGRRVVRREDVGV